MDALAAIAFKRGDRVVATVPAGDRNKYYMGEVQGNVDGFVHVLLDNGSRMLLEMSALKRGVATVRKIAIPDAQLSEFILVPRRGRPVVEKDADPVVRPMRREDFRRGDRVLADINQGAGKPAWYAGTATGRRYGDKVIHVDFDDGELNTILKEYVRHSTLKTLHPEMIPVNRVTKYFRTVDPKEAPERPSVKEIDEAGPTGPSKKSVAPVDAETPSKGHKRSLPTSKGVATSVSNSIGVRPYTHLCE